MSAPEWVKGETRDGLVIVPLAWADEHAETLATLRALVLVWDGLRDSNDLEAIAGKARALLARVDGALRPAPRERKD